MSQGGTVIFTGHPADVKERVQDLICESFSFYPDLQENTDEGYYTIYLHSEAGMDLSEDEATILDILGITDDPQESTEAIKRLFNLEFVMKLTREEKIKFLIDSIWHIEGATVGPAYFESYTDEELEKEVNWYDYLWGK
jgi:hypothetical protein